MTETVNIVKLNEVHIRVKCSPSLAKEISEWFTFMVPNYQHMPKFKSGFWDGKIRLFHWGNRTLPIGLASELRERLINDGYEVIYDPALEPEHVSVDDISNFLASQSLKFKPRDYQLKAWLYALREKRCLLVSPTASGKSFIIFLLLQYLNRRSLVIVPKINLVTQMTNDFKEYDLTGQVGKDIHKIMAGTEKETDRRIVISTWQSAYKMDHSWFGQFDVLIGDEVHNFRADCLQEITSKTLNTKYKIGLTGTLDGSLTNEMVLRGQFGSVKVVTTTKELTDRKEVAKLQIKTMVLDYPAEIKKAIIPRGKKKNWDYQKELEFLFAYEPRNKFIRALARSLEGNTLIIFRYIEHGKGLHDKLKAKADCPVYWVDGKVKDAEREEIRTIVNTHQKSITVASSKVFSEGINIPNLNNIIFASPSKSRINVLQSIGRVLRKTDEKHFCQLYDIADDLSSGSWKNYSLEHYLERVIMYETEQHDNKQINVGIIK